MTVVSKELLLTTVEHCESCDSFVLRCMNLRANKCNVNSNGWHISIAVRLISTLLCRRLPALKLVILLRFLAGWGRRGWMRWKVVWYSFIIAKNIANIYSLHKCYKTVSQYQLIGPQLTVISLSQVNTSHYNWLPILARSAAMIIIIDAHRCGNFRIRNTHKKR